MFLTHHIYKRGGGGGGGGVGFPTHPINKPLNPLGSSISISNHTSMQCKVMGENNKTTRVHTVEYFHQIDSGPTPDTRVK